MRVPSSPLVPVILAALGLSSTVAAAPPPEDRAAILAMQGEYAVTFRFEETVPLAAGYEARESKDSGAREVVILVEWNRGARPTLVTRVLSRPLPSPRA